MTVQVSGLDLHIQTDRDDRRMFLLSIQPSVTSADGFAYKKVPTGNQSALDNMYPESGLPTRH
ncbi:MAG: hypothetical protein LBV12_01930 [Puniceicoccales bacterium]|jgi:hypothetical protein|nr:hypothetical protein [Puniceicoccales bacterium]